MSLIAIIRSNLHGAAFVGNPLTIHQITDRMFYPGFHFGGGGAPSAHYMLRAYSITAICILSKIGKFRFWRTLHCFNFSFDSLFTKTWSNQWCLPAF
jgi:hypothetical protein